MQNKQDYLGKSLLILALAGVGATALYAWTGPSNNPPLANVSTPVNLGATEQIKVGDICTTWSGTKKCLSTVSGLQGPKGDKGDTGATGPTGGGVTSVGISQGITSSVGGSITTSGTLGLDFVNFVQKRLSGGPCDYGIKSVDSNGSITCASAPVIPQQGVGNIKAWANMISSGTNITLINSSNVSSVVRNSTGRYTMNFSSPLPDSSYTAIATCGTEVHWVVITNQTTNSISFGSYHPNWAWRDGCNPLNVAIIR